MKQANEHQYTKEEIILNVLSLVPDNSFSPVQIQKLFFLLEKRLQLNCFNFIPYHYGPYDRSLTDALTALAVFSGKIEIKNIDGVKHYQISSSSYNDISNFFDDSKRKFIREMVSFIKKLSFKQLCMAIYKEFPEMAQNSVFFKRQI